MHAPVDCNIDTQYTEFCSDQAHMMGSILYIWFMYQLKSGCNQSQPELWYFCTTLYFLEVSYHGYQKKLATGKRRKKTIMENSFEGKDMKENDA